MYTRTRTTLPVLFLLGCTPDAGKDTGPGTGTVLTGLAEALVGHEYLLDSAEGFDPVADTTVRIGFDTGPRGGLKFSLSAGCNQMEGSFELVDDIMDVSSVAMTEMGCEADLMAQDDWLVAFMTAAPSVALDGDDLTLTGPDATLLFVDREVADPDRTLTGNTWTIDSFIEGEAVTNYGLETPPTIVFTDEGTVSVTTGCNDGDGTYTVDGDQLTFASMTFTEMECLDEVAAAAESHIAAVVADGPTTHTIDAARLTIERDSIGISATTD